MMGIMLLVLVLMLIMVSSEPSTFKRAFLRKAREWLVCTEHIYLHGVRCCALVRPPVKVIQVISRVSSQADYGAVLVTYHDNGRATVIFLFPDLATRHYTHIAVIVINMDAAEAGAR